MLARRYEYKAYLEDCDPVFLISNAPRIRLGSSYLESVADASTDELEAPSLVVRPFFENDSLSKEDIWSYFLYDDLDKPEVPEEILRAFRGEESDWKVVRCEIKPDTILFLCVDPQKLKRESVQELFERTGKVAGAAEHDFDFEHGVFWVCLTLGERRCKVGADIFVRGGGIERHYRVSDIRKNEHLVFREYDDRGEVLRMSVLEVDDYDKPYDYATIDVVECFE